MRMTLIAPASHARFPCTRQHIIGSILLERPLLPLRRFPFIVEVIVILLRRRLLQSLLGWVKHLLLSIVSVLEERSRQIVLITELLLLLMILRSVLPPLLLLVALSRRPHGLYLWLLLLLVSPRLFLWLVAIIYLLRWRSLISHLNPLLLLLLLAPHLKSLNLP